jgi:hypothetical protein
MFKNNNNISWFNKARIWAKGGINVHGHIHTAHPVRECPVCKMLFGEEFCPKCGKEKGYAGWLSKGCTKCGNSSSGFVFRSDYDQYMLIICCRRCHKYTPEHLPLPDDNGSAIKF